jgi:hypothetical protein
MTSKTQTEHAVQTGVVLIAAGSTGGAFVSGAIP